MSRVWMREHVPCSNPFPLVDFRCREGHVTVCERTEEVKSPQHDNNQETTTCIQHPLKCFIPDERKQSITC